MITYIVTDQGREAYEELSRALQQIEEMVQVGPSDIMEMVNPNNTYFGWNEFAQEFSRHFANPTLHHEPIAESGILGTSGLEEKDLEEFVEEGWLERNDPDKDLIELIHDVLQMDEWLFRLGTPELSKKVRALTSEQKDHIRNLYQIEPQTKEDISKLNTFIPIRRFFLYCIGIT